MINEDIEKAEKYINIATFDGNIHRLSEPAILLLASRIALFQENWDEVIRTGELFLAQNSVILNLNDQDTTLFGTEKGLSNKIFTMMDGTINKEVVLRSGLLVIPRMIIYRLRVLFMDWVSGLPIVRTSL